MKKKLNRYSTYAKGDGLELRETRFVSSQEEINDIIADDQGNFNDELFNDLDYSSNKITWASFDTSGGDWDDPTGADYELVSYEAEKSQISQQISELEQKIKTLKKSCE